MKYYGTICFIDEVESETEPGVWEEQVTERKYAGDVLKRRSRYADGNSINGDLNITNELSIVADQFAYNHFSSIRYAEYMKTKWKVTNVEVNPPRLLLTLGGVYNGDQGPQTESAQ